MIEDHVQNRRKAIIQAAQRRFAHFGLEKATMDEIATDVGLGKASLYYYFPTKESLFKAVIAHEQEQFVERLKPIVESSLSSLEKLTAYAEQRAVYFQGFVNLNNLNLRSFFDAKPLFGDLFRELGHEDLRMLTEIINEGVERGEFTFPAEMQSAELLLHVLQGLGLRSLRDLSMEPNQARRSEALRCEVRAVMQLLMHGILHRNHQKD